MTQVVPELDSSTRTDLPAAEVSGAEFTPAPSPVPSRGRVALVIGNGAYTQPGTALTNPRNDAQAIGAALEGLGFRVTLLADQTKSQMSEAIGDFIEQLGSTDIEAEAGVIFYAGHGVQVDGENYLLPTDCSIKNEIAFVESAIALDTIVRRLEVSTRAGLIFLDCCRDNPFPIKTRSLHGGLAKVDAPAGTFIAFSTAPGAVARDGEPGARNSPFTASLVAHLHDAGISVSQLMIRVRREVFQRTKGYQMPWDSSSLLVDFAFKPLMTEAGLTVPAQAPATGPIGLHRGVNGQKEEEYWGLTKRSNSEQLLGSFIAQYPFSKHGPEAVRKIHWIRARDWFFKGSLVVAVATMFVAGYLGARWLSFEQLEEHDLIGGDIALPQQGARGTVWQNFSRGLSVNTCKLKCVMTQSCIAFNLETVKRNSTTFCYLKHDADYFVGNDEPTVKTMTSGYIRWHGAPVLSPFDIKWDRKLTGELIDSATLESKGVKLTPGAGKTFQAKGLECTSTCDKLGGACAGFTYISLLGGQCFLFKTKSGILSAADGSEVEMPATYSGIRR